MRTLSGQAQTDIVKLVNGKPWVEVLDLTLPGYFTPADEELAFIATDPGGRHHILLSNAMNEGRIYLAAAGWATGALTPAGKWFWCVPYQRDDIEDSDGQRGEVNTRLTLGDTGGVIKGIVDRCDGMNGLPVTIGAAMVDTDSALAGFLECHEPDVVYDFKVRTTSHDNVNFSMSLCVDSPIEWKFPPRTMFKNVCPFAFRGLECGFDGSINQIVRPSRGRDLPGRQLFPGHWAICGGYVERLDPDGALVTKRGFGMASDYVFLTSTASNYYFAARSNNRGLHWYNGTTFSFFPDTGTPRTILNSAYPFENTISSGGHMDAYAVTNTAATRYLCHFADTAWTRVGSVGTAWQYYNIVSSAAANVAFAVQGGTYSGGSFTPSNQPTGRLVVVNHVTQTSINEATAWKWVRAISATRFYAMASNGALFMGDGSGTSFTLSPVMDGLSFDTPPPSQVFVDGDLSRSSFSVFSATGLVFMVSGGRLAVIDNDWCKFLDGGKDWDYKEYEWGTVNAVSDNICVAANDAGMALVDVYSMPTSELRLLKTAGGYLSGFLPAGEISEYNIRLYYAAGSDIYFYENKDFAGCAHTMADCKERGNETRFGGFPGIGSGGLAQ